MLKNHQKTIGARTAMLHRSLLVTLIALFTSKAICSQFLDSLDFDILKARSVQQDGKIHFSEHDDL